MLPALAPILFPTGLPRRGLIAWHDLWFPNILRQSNAFGTTWGVDHSAVVESASVYVPGSTTRKAWKLVGNDELDNYHNITQAPPSIAGAYTFAVTLKAAEVSWAYTRMYDGTKIHGCYFDLQNGVVGTTASGTTASMVSLGDGWWRCSITGTVSAVASMISNVFLAEADGDYKMDGGGTAPYTEADPGIYIADAQLYPAAALPSYVATSTLQSESGLLDISGNGYHLSRGSNSSAADSNDPTVLGPGLSATTDDGANTAALSLDKASAFTVLWIGKPSGSTGTLFSLTDSATASTKYQRVAYSESGAVKIGSAAGGAESLSDALTVDATAYQVLALTSDGTTLTLKRMDTGTSVTVADTNPDGNARFALFSTAGSTLCANPCDAAIALGDLPYNRALSSAELTRAYRYLKSQWASRGIVVL
jgi:hypothetical protein